MKLFSIACLGFALSMCQPCATSAQIISTMVPTEITVGSALHLMGGYADWDFTSDGPPLPGVTGSGGDGGAILAADLAIRSGGQLAVGVGGWMNKVADLTVNYPAGLVSATAATSTFARSAYSVYANVFYQHIGIQTEVVRFTGTETVRIAGASTITDDDGGQTDLDAFLVGRFGSRESRERPWSAMVGGGLYRYGSRPENTGARVGPASPASNVFTGFVNGSVGVFKRVSVDGSVWYTAADEGSGRGIGNAQQTRLTIGAGYRF